MATRLQGRMRNRSGAPGTGLVSVGPMRSASPDPMVDKTLDATGQFIADLTTAVGYMVVDPEGRRWAVDASTTTPTVRSQQSAGSYRLEIDYLGSPDMVGQTPSTVAASARTEAESAAAAATAAQQAVPAVAGAVNAMTVTLQAALLQIAAQQAKQVRLVVGRASVPNLALNSTTDVPVAWAADVVPVSAVALLEPTGSLLGRVTATVKTGSLSKTGCTVTLQSPILLALGAGSVVVVGAYLA